MPGDGGGTGSVPAGGNGGASGQSSVGAQNGSGPGGAANGTGGASGGAPAGEGVAENALEIVDGAVVPGSNPFLIYGQLRVAVGQNYSPATVTFDPYGACASGSLAPMPSDTLGIWSLRIGLTLSEPEGATFGNPWDRYSGRVDGFSFELEGPVIPSELRFGMYTAGPTMQQFCKVLGVVQSGERIEVLFNEMTVTCWELGGSRAEGDLFLYDVSWEVPGDPDSDVPYDFCLREIAPMFAN
jgi:hypothetical protein